MGGCSSSSSANKIQYMLDPGSPEQTAAGQGQTMEAGSIPGHPSSDRVLEVDRFTIDAAFSGKSLTYRTSELQYQTDFYNEFLVLPAVMITEETRDWLMQSGLFRRVVGAASRAAPTHLLEGNIVKLYGDMRDKVAPKTVIEIRIFVSRFDSDGRPAFVFGKDYSVTSPVESRDPAGLVDAYSRCLHSILTDVQADLAQHLSKDNAPPHAEPPQ